MIIRSFDDMKKATKSTTKNGWPEINGDGVPATEKQIAFVESLVKQKDIPIVVRDYIERRAIMMSKSEASDVLGYLIPKPNREMKRNYSQERMWLN